MASSAVRCTRCGATLAVGSDGASLCPVCLLSSALIDWTAEDAASKRADDSDVREVFPYELTTIIARGRGTTTYLARAFGQARPIVVTVAPPSAQTPSIRERAVSWRHALLRVRHDHVARVVDVGAAPNGFVYVASEYVPGTPLGELLRRGTMSAMQCDAILEQLSDALAHLHASGVAHMRFGPRHVRVTGDAQPHVTIVGVGVAMIVHGLAPDASHDRLALTDVTRTMRAALDTPAVGS